MQGKEHSILRAFLTLQMRILAKNTAAPLSDYTP